MKTTGLIVCALCLFPTAAWADWPMAGAMAGTTDWMAQIQDLWGNFEAWALDGYRRAPALMLGVAAAFMLPPLALAGLLLRGRRKPPARHFDDVPMSIPVSAWQQKAWLEILAEGGGRFDIRRDLTRIGREEDNDLQLAHASIHRYHAVIERSPDMIFTIQDISGSGGNGVRVGGRALERTRLRGGELVEIGAAKLRFHVTAI